MEVKMKQLLMKNLKKHFQHVMKKYFVQNVK